MSTLWQGREMGKRRRHLGLHIKDTSFISTISIWTVRTDLQEKLSGGITMLTSVNATFKTLT